MNATENSDSSQRADRTKRRKRCVYVLSRYVALYNATIIRHTYVAVLYLYCCYNPQPILRIKYNNFKQYVCIVSLKVGVWSNSKYRSMYICTCNCFSSLLDSRLEAYRDQAITPRARTENSSFSKYLIFLSTFLVSMG